MNTSIIVRRISPALYSALICVIAGGVITAFTAHAPARATNWVAAYLVLVCGLGTAGLAVGRGFLGTKTPEIRALGLDFSVWILGNIFVMGGSLTSRPLVVDLGSVCLVIALARIVVGVSKAGEPVDGVNATRPAFPRLRRAFLALVLILLISIPIGSVLTHLRV